MIYKVRAHHGMCFSFFKGKGYSDAFTQNMWKMKEELAQNPEIVLLQETDDVCRHCPNNRAGKCSSMGKTEAYDRQVLALCGLTAGTQMRWQAFEGLVRARILETGMREAICGDCEWSSLCHFHI